MTDAASIEREPWRYGPSAYLAALGIPDQGPAHRAAYQRASARRSIGLPYDGDALASWEQAAVARGRWRTLLLAAYDAGEFSVDGDADPAAVAVVTRALRDRAEAESRARRMAALESNAFDSTAEIAVGSRVWDTINRRYGIVSKVGRVDVVYDPEDTTGKYWLDRPYRVGWWTLRRLDPAEVDQVIGQQEPAQIP